MKIHRRNGIDFYCFENLAAFPALCHGITTRQGGGSQSPFDSLNMSLHVGDAADQVAANREAVWSGFPRPAEPVFLNQVHGSTVVVWDGKAPSADPRLSGEADAIVTDQHGWLLTILVADCQPVLLYDPVRSVIANIHSGWRGSIADIIGRTVTVMKTVSDAIPLIFMPVWGRRWGHVVRNSCTIERKFPNRCGLTGCRRTILIFGP